MQKDIAMLEKSDRTWPLPNQSHAMRMDWHDLLFAHWPVNRETIQELIPSPLEVDIWDNQAWIALVPFRMTDVAPRFVPAIPGLSDFPELNVRTYVTMNGKPGVWFFSLDATNRLAVRIARVAFHLPYMDARMSLRNEGEWYHYASVRTHRNERPAEFRGQYRPDGEVFYAEPGSFEHWLTARYCLYASNSKGHVFRGEIDHPPWPLQAAEWVVEKNNYFEEFDVNMSFSPHLLFSERISVKAWLNQRVA